MIESLVIRDLIAEKVQETILSGLVARFGQDAERIQSELDPIKDEKRLQRLAKQAAVCPDLDALRKLLEL